MPTFPDVATRVLPLATRWQLDTVLAAGLAVGALAHQEAAGVSRGPAWTTPLVALVSVAAIAVRRRTPFVATAVFSGAICVVSVLDGSNALNGPPSVFAWVPFVLAYGLGTATGLAAGAAGAFLLAGAAQTTSPAFNPLFEMITFGPWLAGRVVRSRRQLGARIEERNDELDSERARFARESVRYERARIARELHDIVAHYVSAIVVQAAAGQRLTATTNPASAAEAIDFITEAAREARTEIGRLVEMLDETDPSDRPRDLDTIDELVQRANRTGLTVRYRTSHNPARLSRPVSAAAYRVVQESLTNAIKHAPGAQVDITLRDTDNHIEVEIFTPAAPNTPSGLEQSGSGRGLAGLNQRVDACGGTFTAGPTPNEGWRVTAQLPTD